jgi:hypothetical protein
MEPNGSVYVLSTTGDLQRSSASGATLVDFKQFGTASTLKVDPSGSALTRWASTAPLARC